MAIRFKIGKTEVVAGGLQVRGAGNLKFIAPAFFALSGWMFTALLIILIGSLLGAAEGKVPHARLILAIIVLFSGGLFLAVSYAWITYLRSTEGNPAAVGRFKKFRTNIYLGLAGYTLLVLTFGLPLIGRLASNYQRVRATAESTAATLQATAPGESRTSSSAQADKTR